MWNISLSVLKINSIEFSLTLSNNYVSWVFVWAGFWCGIDSDSEKNIQFTERGLFPPKRAVSNRTPAFNFTM